MRIRQLFLFSLLGIAVGCTQSRTYQVSVENQLSTPVTLWLVKDEGPEQSDWLSPEQVAESNPINDEELPDLILQPNRSATVGPLEGKFYTNRGRASLRVYSGTPTLTQMLAIERGGLIRYDQLLQPGSSSFIIRERTDGGIGVVRKGATTQPTAMP